MLNMFCQSRKTHAFGVGRLHYLQITKSSPERPDNTTNNEMIAADAEPRQISAKNNSYQYGLEMLFRSPPKNKNYVYAYVDAYLCI